MYTTITAFLNEYGQWIAIAAVALYAHVRTSGRTPRHQEAPWNNRN